MADCSQRRRFFTLLLMFSLTDCKSRARRDRAIEAVQSKPERTTAAEQLFRDINTVRQQHRAPGLTWHAGAAELAQSHSDSMARRGFFSHTDPQRGDLAARAKEARLRWSAIAENLFQQRGCPDLVRCAVEGWLNSAGHRRNMLNPEYTHTGIGISRDKGGVVYYTQILLAPASRA